jgi:hypothetical protein
MLVAKAKAMADRPFSIKTAVTASQTALSFLMGQRGLLLGEVT